MPARRVVIGFVLLLLYTATLAHGQEKKPLDHDVYAIWNRITEKDISNDGQWIWYRMSPENEDGYLIVTNPENNRRYEVPRGKNATFGADSRHVIFLISPPKDSTRHARLDGKKGDDLPADSLGIINLSTGDYFLRSNVKSFKMPEDTGRYVAYSLHSNENPEPDTTAVEEEGDENDDKKDKDVGTTLVLRDLQNSTEYSYLYSTGFNISQSGSQLVFTKSSDEAVADGAFVVNSTDGSVDTLRVGVGEFKKPTIDATGSQAAFISNDETFDQEDETYQLYYSSLRDGETIAVAADNVAGLGPDSHISQHGDVRFSEDGGKLFFATAPDLEEVPEDDNLLDEEKVVVDVWSWTDEEFYPAQKVNLENDRKRSYLAVYHPRANEAIQIADEAVPTISLLDDGDGDIGLANSSFVYRKLRSWDWPTYQDVYAVDLEDGSHRKLAEAVQANATLSPDGRFAAWWNRQDSSWYAVATSGKEEPVNISQAIATPLYNEIHDWPYPADAYGRAGWSSDPVRLVVYDKHDVWALDPEGKRPPENLTNGVGSDGDERLRYVRLDPDEKAINLKSPLLLSSFDYSTKETGFYELNADRGQVSRLVEDQKWFTSPTKAKDSDRIIFTRESFTEFPDVWYGSRDFSSYEKVSDANPQQKEYFWGTAELVTWRTTDGIKVEGILYKPEGFDASKQYPLMVYFYEKNSSGLYRHHTPAPHRSVINRSFYASRGYLVFVPDIPYKIGYPGESAMNAVMPGVTELIATGFVDEDNIGVQGHSWGGYQIAYMVTKTNLFKAAEAGAPVSNMISAYGGVRWRSGLSRMFQYERTQSRIGGSLWEYPLRYISNSPIFEADKIETPLLIMHNDKDGAVPWYQGIELFAALRRLNKPVWLINYNDEPHWPTTFHNKVDWTTRLQQYFDHYLKGDPAPEWLERGIPAIRKGTTLGLESVPSN